MEPCNIHHRSAGANTHNNKKLCADKELRRIESAPCLCSHNGQHQAAKHPTTPSQNRARTDACAGSLGDDALIHHPINARMGTSGMLSVQDALDGMGQPMVRLRAHAAHAYLCLCAPHFLFVCVCVSVCLCICLHACMCVCAHLRMCLRRACIRVHAHERTCMYARSRRPPAPRTLLFITHECVRACVRACVLLCAGASPGQGSARVWAHGGQRRWHAPPACPTPPQPPPAAAHAPRRAPHA